MEQIAPLYKVDINFDESIQEWNANKKKLPNELYKYVCENKEKSCQRVCYKNLSFCYIHRKMETSINSK